jgi:hypothetical protein
MKMFTIIKFVINVKSPVIVPVLKVGSLERVGHGVRTDGERTAKTLLEGRAVRKR